MAERKEIVANIPTRPSFYVKPDKKHIKHRQCHILYTGLLSNHFSAKQNSLIFPLVYCFFQFFLISSDVPYYLNFIPGNVVEYIFHLDAAFYNRLFCFTFRYVLPTLFRFGFQSLACLFFIFFWYVNWMLYLYSFVIRLFLQGPTSIRRFFKMDSFFLNGLYIRRKLQNEFKCCSNKKQNMIQILDKY